MWIYVLCGGCGKNIERLAARSELSPLVPIEMDDGSIAAEILLSRCPACRAARAASATEEATEEFAA